MALPLALSACGGGSGEAAATLTKARFLRKGNAICARGGRELIKLSVEGWKKYRVKEHHTSQAVEDELVRSMLPVRKEEVRRIRALGLPRGEGKRVQRVLAAWEEGIEKGEADPHSLRESGPGSAFYESSAMGIDYGLVKCWLG